VIVDNGREVVIRVRGLAKSFGSYQIWDGLSLDVYRGEILAIVGGSGQGKSVLMRVITGLVKPDAGEVGLFGQSTKTLTPQDRLGHPLPGWRAVLLADGVAEHPGADARASRAAAGDDGRSRLSQACHGRPAAQRRA
jgi:ABC-type phosphonate transport system ATPase subunit